MDVGFSSPAGNTNITGGSINGTPIGQTTPAAGKFTTLQATQSATLDGGIGSYNGVATLGNGVPAIYAEANRAAQAADVAATTLYAIPVGRPGMYRVSCYAVVTQAATTSSTLPNIGVLWTDNDSNTPLSAANVTSTNTANAVGAFAQGQQIIYAKAGTNIQYQTSNYASSGATPMQFAMHVTLEYLG
jgi:hypothetical protein